MIEKLPEVQQTPAANPTWSAVLVYGEEVLVDELVHAGRQELGTAVACFVALIKGRTATSDLQL